MNQNIRNILEKIAREALRLETLEVRNSDRLDFSEQYVACIRDALERAYHQGYQAAQQDDVLKADIARIRKAIADGTEPVMSHDQVFSDLCEHARRRADRKPSND